MPPGQTDTTLTDCGRESLGQRGHEFGATTGRPRRCGWFDAVALKAAVQINSISGICLTKLDVLDGLEQISICVGYTDAEGNEVMGGAENYDDLHPVYEQVSGWSESTVGAQRVEDLPEAAVNYIKRLESLVGAPIDIISTGPDRAETIVLRNPYA